MINSELHEKYGSKKLLLKKGTFLFYEGEKAINYFEVITGAIKMVNFSDDGQEFIQGIFEKGESFGEPPLFAGINYPSNAVAIEETLVWKLSRENFLLLLQENFDLHLSFTIKLSQRLHYKATIMKGISNYTPEKRIITFIDYMKKESQLTDNQLFEVPFTRQQIADMTGLRVETVIRAIKSLEIQGKLKIKNRKVFR